MFIEYVNHGKNYKMAHINWSVIIYLIFFMTILIFYLSTMKILKNNKPESIKL